MFDAVEAQLRAWHVALAWLCALALAVLVGGVGALYLMRLAGGLEIFDLRVGGYSAAEAGALLAALGDGGRRAYRWLILPDMLLPPALFLALSLLFIRLTSPRRRLALPLPDGLRLVVVALAFVACLADWGENIVQFIMLLSAAPPAETLAGLGSTLTVVKTCALTLAVLAVLATAALALLRGLPGRRRAA